MKLIKFIIFIFNGFVKKFKKTDPNLWLFNSYLGDYNDSPRLISEYVHKMYPKINICWLLKPELFNIVPNYVKKININDKKISDIYISKSSVIVDNIYGPKATFLFNGNLVNKIVFIFNSFFEKRLHQKIFTCLHGMEGFKATINESENLKTKYMSFGNLYMLIGTKKSIDQLKKITLLRAKDYYFCGCPRNDIFGNNHLNKECIKKKLKLPFNKKIILYAPTFRGDAKSTHIDDEWSSDKLVELLNIKKIIAAFKNKFKKDFVIVLRIHHLAKKTNKMKLIYKKYSDILFDGNLSPDMMDYLSITDILISDYSSCMFDFIFTKKPTFIFAPDFENYDKNRGIKMKFEDTPFYYSFNNNELIKQINLFNKEEYEIKVTDFMRERGYYLRFDGTKRAVNYIIHKTKYTS